MLLEFSPGAGADLDEVLFESASRFGAAAADRYRRLIAAALRDLRTDHRRLNVRTHPGLAAKVYVYHLRYSDKRAAGVSNPRHMIVFRLGEDTLTVLRLLHDAMDLTRHLSGSDLA